MAHTERELINLTLKLYRALQNISINGSVSQIIPKYDRDLADAALKECREVLFWKGKPKDY